MSYYNGFGWAPYVPVAERRHEAQREVEKLRKAGKQVSPVQLEGRTIAGTFWGKAWCGNLESYSDYSNRLPRGRTYVRNGSVVDLQIAGGSITALVSGSSIYKIKIDIAPAKKDRWQGLVKECAGRIDSLVELLRGKFSKGVMEVISRKDKGLFPSPGEIKMSCSCPDSASLCKHLAATLYGVGARLDKSPELLFVLRGVDHRELLTQVGQGDVLDQGLGGKQDKLLGDADLSELFGIDLDGGEQQAARPKGKPKATTDAKTITKPKAIAEAKPKAKAAAHPKAGPKAKPAPRPKAKVAAKATVPVQPPVKIRWTRQELLAEGIPSSTIASWTQSGLLQRTETRGVYTASDVCRRLLAIEIGE